MIECSYSELVVEGCHMRTTEIECVIFRLERNFETVVKFYMGAFCGGVSYFDLSMPHSRHKRIFVCYLFQ